MKCSLPLSVIGILASTACLAEEPLIYKSIAADGTVVYTDKPAPEATVVTPSPLNIMDAQDNDTVAVEAGSTEPDGTDISATAASTTTPDSDAAIAFIDGVTIVSPQHQQTLIDHEGPIWVGIQTSPAPTLPQGLSAEIRLDGALVVSGWSTTLPMDVPERGAHVLQATIVDANGAVLAESDEIDLYIKQRVTVSNNGQ